eukprot:GDKI01002632.1.p1 GENE.GDKI01002632.1~~GDKI01002632.1.p1  ORF type:complete len:200 (-),score=78.08 GDKI01002632.1:21-599(-)
MSSPAYESTAISSYCTVCGCPSFCGHYKHCWADKKGVSAADMSHGCATLLRYAYLSDTLETRVKAVQKTETDETLAQANGRRLPPTATHQREHAEVSGEMDRLKVCTQCFRGRTEQSVGSLQGGGINGCFCVKSEGGMKWGECTIEEASEGLTEWLEEHGKEAVVSEFEKFFEARPPYTPPGEEEEEEEEDG